MQFLHESNIEDFVTQSDETVMVSTIHKTKGREFDNVILALNSSKPIDDEVRRAIYVAITRAKENLHIYYNASFFDKINAQGIERLYDDTQYPASSVISLHLSHSNVQLSRFKQYREALDTLMSGQELEVCNSGCMWEGREIIKFSAKFMEEVKKLRIDGYKLVKAHVRHIVYWKGKGMDDEIKIVLPNVEFSQE